jgi:hydroxyacylglutathione hydrolase
MSRVSKPLVAVVLILCLGLVAAVSVQRFARGRHGEAHRLSATLAGVTSASVGVWAAKVDGAVVLFDAGVDPDARWATPLLDLLGASAEDVRDIFLTHGHGDHVAGAVRFPKARVWAGQDDVALAAGNVHPETLAERLLTSFAPPPPVHVSNPLTVMMDIPVGPRGHAVRCIPMPGHTPGSFAYLFERVLFVGDTMTYAGGRLGPPVALFDAHPEANRRAVLALAEVLAPDSVDRVCAAHGGCTEPGAGQRLLADFVAELRAAGS